MFWAFMYWYFFGGGTGAISAGALTPAAVEQLSNRIEIVIEDPGRAEAAQLTLGEVREVVESFEKDFDATSKAVARSYRDHADDRAEIDAVLDQLNRDWERGQERVLDLRFELREQLTREEWAALYSEE